MPSIEKDIGHVLDMDMAECGTTRATTELQNYLAL